MSRLLKPRGKIVRRFGVNLFGNPKYDRLLERKPQGPGADPKARKKKPLGDYGLQLMEKQKLRYNYGLTERQMRNLYRSATKLPGSTDEILYYLLERSLANIVYRSGMGQTRMHARQLVSHGHIFVNGRKADIPSMVLNSGDQVSFVLLSKTSASEQNRNSIYPLPPWLVREAGTVILSALPSGTQDAIARMHRVVEWYARN